MTKSVDERIVQMRFDNKQFESGVSTTMSSLDKLKHGLKFDDAAKSLSNLEKAGKNFSLNGIAQGVDALQNKFSALGIVGITAIQNVTNSAINMGKRVVSALTIDPIKMGFDEYETKMNAIQTIMTNTASKGTTMDDVTKALNELNTYADQTIYNFAEMTRNIGTFTAAGVDLKTSTEAIKGIANLAAGSGSNAQQASTAMYQLSQAMATGTVKLMDWNSVVNAGMGGELFQKALEKTALQLGHGRSMAVSFRDSLEKGWLTTEVLTKTLQKFANDKSLIQAATQVKTFTQLFDTMKESVQSGWAQTWENIIGNKDDAAGLLTQVNNIFGSVVGASAAARNKMLSFWKDNGGRYAIIEALFNAFKGLQEVMSPIGDAFREIFPPMTGEKLVEISIAIRDLSRNFKVSDETAENIKRTFKGLFAVLDIGKQLFMALANGVGTIIKAFAPAGSGVLSFTAIIGDFLVALDNAIKTSGIFTFAIGKVCDAIKIIAVGIKLAITAIAKAFGLIDNIDLSGLQKFTDKTREILSPISKFLEQLQNGFNKLAVVVKKIATVIGGALKVAFEGLGKTFSDTKFDMDTMMDVFNIGVLTAIILGFKKFIGYFTGLMSSGKGFLDGVTGVLDGVKGSLEAYQSSLKADVLLKIAVAIGILAGALILLSDIDPDKLVVAMGGITTLFAELFGSMAGLSKIMGMGGFVAVTKTTIAMLSMSAAVLILAVAMKKMAELDWDSIARGGVSLVILSGVIIGISRLMDKNSKGIVKGAASFILFSLGLASLANGLKRLSSVVEALGNIDSGKLTKGLIGIGVLLAEILLFSKLSGMEKTSVKQGLGMIAFAYSLSVLAEAVSKFASMDVGSIAKSLISIGLLLGEIGLFMKLTGSSKSTIANSLALVVLAQSLFIFASAIERMAGIPWDVIGKGLLTIGTTLVIVAGALKLLPKGIAVDALGLFVVANALVVLSGALLIMGNMSVWEIAKSLVALAGSMTIMALAMNAMTAGVAGAASLMAITAALTFFIPTLVILGNLPLSVIGVGLLGLAGIFTVFGVAGLLLAPVSPVILALSASIAIFGVACLAVGAGMTLFAGGLAALAVSGVAGAVAIKAIFLTIVSLVPLAAKTLALGIIDLVKIIGSGAPIVGNALVKLLTTLCDVIIKMTPKIINLLTTIIPQFLTFLVGIIPKLIDAGAKIILALLEGIKKYAGKIIGLGIDIMVKFIQGVASKLPAIVDIAFKAVIQFINGLAEAIRKNHNALYNACGNLIKSIAEAIGDLLPKVISVGGDIVKSLAKGISGAVGELGKAGKNVVDGFIGGIKAKIGSAVDMAKDLGSKVSQGTKDVLDINSPSKVFQDFGANIVAGLQNGIKQDTPKAVTESKTMASKVVGASKEEFDKAVAWIKERKSLGKLSLKEELAEWEKLQHRYAKGTEERKKADAEAYRVKQSLNKAGADADKKAFDKAISMIEDKKYYNQLSLKQELAAWEKLQKQYKVNSEERKKIDREVYRVKQEMIQAATDAERKAFDKAVEVINDKKYYNKLSLEAELKAWQTIQSKYKVGSDERKQADKEVYRVKQDIIKAGLDAEKAAFDKSVEWINEKKYYNQLTLSEELTAWEEIQTTYKQGSEERKQADREVYRVKQELIAKQKEIDEDYYSKTKELNDKLKSDIQSVNAEYEQAVKSRADALYASYGLFDKIEQKDPVSGSDLVNNLRDQVSEFEIWQKSIVELSKKGIDEGLIKELRDMGPKSSAQIQALNSLSSTELGEYVNLWQTKYGEARTQALLELEPMKVETQNKILALTKQTETDLETYKKAWITKTQELTSGVSLEFDTLSTEVPNKISTMRANVEQEFATLVTNVKTIFVSQKWSYIGANIVLGITSGIRSNAVLLANEAANTARMALEAAKNALGIHSPSTEFAKLGMYANQGFAIGLNQYSGLISDAGENTGNVAINSLKGAMSRISDVLTDNLDMVPTIRPVLDLTDVEAGGQKINDIMSAKRGINVSNIASKIPLVGQTSKIDSPNQNGSDTPSQVIHFEQNNYSPSALSRIDIYRQTKNQLSTMKGLVTNI